MPLHIRNSRYEVGSLSIRAPSVWGRRLTSSYYPISERLRICSSRRLFLYPNTGTNPGAYPGTMHHSAPEYTISGIPCRFTRSSVWSPCSAICAYYPRAGRYSKFNSQKREKTMRPRQHAPSPSSDRFFCCPRQRSAPSGITPFCRITTGVNSPPTKNYGFKCRPHQRETTPLVLILS